MKELSTRTEWLLCPLCNSKTRDRIREDTILANYPLYCPKCKRETLVEVKNLQTKIIVAAYRLAWIRMARPSTNMCAPVRCASLNRKRNMCGTITLRVSRCARTCRSTSMRRNGIG